VLDYYGYSHPQCEIAEYTRNVSTWHDFGSTPCCSNALQGCNYWNYNWGAAGSIQDILVHFGNISNSGKASFLLISEIQNNFNQNRPFIMRWGWKDSNGNLDGSGHFLVGHGIQGNNVYYMDPWFGEGYKVSTYENVRNDMWHEWTHTNILLVSPNLSGIENVATENSISIYPNPVKNELRIENGELKINNVELFDLTGKIIFNFQFSTINSINVSALPQGIYLVKITTDKRIITKKIVK
jgi:hypothetical protein